MPIMNKRKRTTRPTTRRRVVPRTVATSRPPRAMSNSVHHYRRMLAGNFSAWGLSTTTSRCAQIAGDPLHQPWLGAFVLRGISDILTPTDFSGLYDQYRINSIVLKFYLKIDPSAQAAASANIPRLYWYRDLDDSSPPLTLDEMRENSKTKITTLNPYKPVTIKLVPNVLAQMFQSPVASQYSPKFKQWLDMSSTSTPHYVGKFAIDDLRNTAFYVQMEGTVYFSCKQPR